MSKPADRRAPRAAILAHVESAGYVPKAQRALFHELGLSRSERGPYREALDRLVEEGRVELLSRGRVAPADAGVAEGVLKRTGEGHGWVSPGGGRPAVFVPAEKLEGTLSGDRVRVDAGRSGRSGRDAGRVRVVEKRRREVVGVLARRDGRWTLRPFEPGIGDLRVPPRKTAGAGEDDVVLARVEETPEGEREGKAAVLEVFGPFGDPGVDVRVVVERFGLRTEFPRPVLAEADRLPARVGPAAKKRRERFDDPAPVTIDGETAQDFDDAIAVRRLPGGKFRLWVHIADVAHFVRPGSELDAEARRRGTSVYFPGTVLPMFPEKISNDLCSLRPAVDRLVQSVVLDLDAEGRTVAFRHADGVIRSAARLTYAQVAEVLEGSHHVAGVPRETVDMLRDANRLRRILERRRRRRGSVDFDLPRPAILLDVEGEMTGIRIEARNRAHRLIEECMLAANEAVAGHLEAAGRDCMYRIHEEPDPAKIDALVEFAGGLGAKPPKGKEAPGPGWIADLLDRFADEPEREVLQQMALRAMKQARYSMDNRGHFGLAAPVYCHFTSPIRRYPDLVVHRLLRRVRGTEATEELAESCSRLERNAESAERELLAWKKAAYIAERLGETFVGVVTGVAPFGAFVQLRENLVEGLVRVEALGSDYWELDEARHRWVGRHTGRRIGLGDELTVRVDRVDRVLRRVDLSVPEARPASAGPARSRGAQQGRRGGRRGGGRRRNAVKRG